MILNLDPTFTPFGIFKSIEYKTSTFPGGEPHLKICTDLRSVNSVQITHRIQSFNDFGLALLAIDALKRLGVKTIKLFIPYFPGARQDRIMTSGEALTVKVYTDILNATHLDEVCILDPHSDVTPALLNHCKTLNNFGFIEDVLRQIPSKDLVLISPDHGAFKKTYKLASHLKKYKMVDCSKHRDLETGKLSHFSVHTSSLNGKDCLIVDDICDGGGTFIGLAKALKEKQAGRIYLAISHGIFSKGLEPLKKELTHIFTTNSFSSISSTEFITQIPIEL